MGLYWLYKCTTRYGYWHVEERSVINCDVACVKHCCVSFVLQRMKETALRMKTENYMLNCKNWRCLGKLFNVLQSRQHFLFDDCKNKWHFLYFISSKTATNTVGFTAKFSEFLRCGVLHRNKRLQWSFSSQLSIAGVIFISSEPQQASSPEQEEGIIPDSPILPSSLPAINKLKKRKNIDKIKHIHYAEMPLPQSNHSLFNGQSALK